MARGNEDSATPSSWRWPVPRLARAAHLYGLGWSLEDIASDLFIQSSPANVRRALRRAGVYDGGPLPPGRYRIDLTRRHVATWLEAARRRHTTSEMLMRRVVEILAEDPTLLENILDDGG